MSVFGDSAIQISIRWPLHSQEADEIAKYVEQLSRAVHALGEGNKAWRSVYNAITKGYLFWKQIEDYAGYVCTMSTHRQQSVAESDKVIWQEKLGSFHKHFCSQCSTAEVINVSDNAPHQSIGPETAEANPAESLAWALKSIVQGLPNLPTRSQTTREEAKDLKEKLEKHIGIVWHVPFDADPLINEPTILPSGCSSREVSPTPSPTFSIPTAGKSESTQP